MTAKDTRELVEAAYPRIASELLEPFVDLLARSRKEFGGDLDKFLLIATIGLRTTTHPQFSSYSAEELIEGRTPMLPNLGINGRSLAESLDIPKETARRKVLELTRSGWLLRDEDGLLYLTEKATRGLAPLRRQLLAMAARYCDVISDLRPQN